MQVDALAIALRPRPMSEAADLGMLLVRRFARSVWGCYLPVWLVACVVAALLFPVAGWLSGLLLFLLKPWFDRVLLFALSRAAFGQPTAWRDVWAQGAAVLFRGLLRPLTIARLSPWRSYTQPVAQLEGQTGGAARKRRAQLLRNGRWAAAGMHLVFAHVELAFVLALFAGVLLFTPKGTVAQLTDWLSLVDPGYQACSTIAYALVVLVLEPFYVAAGFSMYLNRRVALEAWDIEQEFRLAFGH